MGILGAGFVIGHGPVLLPDDHKARVGAPVGQMVIAALQTDGAQIADKDRGIVGVRGDDPLGDPAVPVQEEQGVHHQPQNGPGEPHQFVHHAGGGILHIGAAALVNGLHQVLMVAVQGGILIKILEGQPLFGSVLEFFLDHEGHGDVLPLVDPVVGDESVHLWPQDEGLANGGADQVEIGILVLSPPGIFLGQIGIQRAQIDVYVDVSLVIGPVRIQMGGKLGHSWQLPQPPAIPPVSPLLLALFQFLSLQFQQTVWLGLLYWRFGKIARMGYRRPERGHFLSPTGWPSRRGDTPVCLTACRKPFPETAGR